MIWRPAASLICLDEAGGSAKITRKKTLMSSRNCKHCQTALCGRDCGWPSCRPASPCGKRTSASAAEAGFSKLPVILIGLVAAVAAAVLYVVLTKEPLPSPDAKPAVVETVDLEGTRGKAERGDAQAQNVLGKIYAKGDLVKGGYKEAAKWYRQAADQGYAAAQAALGELYEAGQGVPKDYPEAAKWYRKAAEQGDVKGQYSLAVLYVVGNGVPRDSKEAMKWYRQAADQGEELAQYALGMRYYEGAGVTPDPVEAYLWLSLAAARGLPDAAPPLAELKRRMTREQLTEAERRVKTFVIKKPTPPAK